ncbi:hypothetical protein IE81DRAFT_366657 [Ceraceosorus guamensis]|uniref:FHA domain-containing protein n=1 Tax=Ceraceosorus guamensis TaxID=1522189 RepID=A0A316VYG4_9BASI|nr:hypothetical protein IE81DRAFT_366657 [Ceraceosorus guamensis]PWN42374.1 hypothetical protein IE81DRAFT_366657 [Ceraceosorus guamensis]
MDDGFLSNDDHRQDYGFERRRGEGSQRSRIAYDDLDRDRRLPYQEEGSWHEDSRLREPARHHHEAESYDLHSHRQYHRSDWHRSDRWQHDRYSDRTAHPEDRWRGADDRWDAGNYDGWSSTQDHAGDRHTWRSDPQSRSLADHYYRDQGARSLQWHDRRHGQEAQWHPSTYHPDPRPAAPDVAAASDAAGSGATGQMRLVALSSKVLPEGRRVAVIDAREESVSIGRDKTFTSRIRLPAMEVSKHHANVFYLVSSMSGAGAWFITDVGSVHGTYHLACKSIPEGAADELASGLPTSRFTRLSEARKASSPMRLDNEDWLRIGDTTFEVHLHGSLACQRCSLHSDGTNEIQLRPSDKKVKSSITDAEGAGAGRAELIAESLQRQVGNKSTTSTTERVPMDRKVETEALRRQRMKDMRKQYLGSQDDEDGRSEESASGQAAGPVYLDRAAARRAMHPGESKQKRAWGRRRSASPGRPAQAQSAESAAMRHQAAGPSRGAGTGTVERSTADPAPLNDSNRGFQMLAKMRGGEEGHTLGDEILARATEGRAGLGSTKLRTAQEISSASSSSLKYGDPESVRRRFEQSMASEGRR